MAQAVCTELDRYKLLQTKFAPPRLRTVRVARPQLVNRLEAGLERKLALISAPAGFGKTTLIGEWMNSRAEGSRPIGWIALDAGDNDPARFWRYVVTACAKFGPNIGQAALAALSGERYPDFEPLLTSLINDLAASARPAVLVLDDYHLIDAPRVNETLAFLLDHLPATVHLILSTRHDPLLPLARWRAHDEMHELRARDLRFSVTEIEAFVRQNTTEQLPPEAHRRLAQQTEGWVAGLQLATLALPRGQTANLAALSDPCAGSQHHVLDYLIEEVLAAQPAWLQQFLLQTTFLTRVGASLCNAVTGRQDSSSVLSRLERANLFLSPLNGDGAWYRYHPLFAEAMQAVARRRLGEMELQALYARACDWYESAGYLPDAVEIALSGQDYTRAATLISRLTQVHHYRELDTLRRWIEQLPEAMLKDYPGVCLHYAIALLFTSDRASPAIATRATKFLSIAEENWQGAENSPQLGQIYAFRAMVSLWQGDFERAFETARKAVNLLADEDLHWRGIAELHCAGELFYLGELNRARLQFWKGRRLSEAAGNAYAVRAATWMLGEICAEQGELAQAEHLYRQVAATAGSDGLDEGHALIGLAQLAYERNQWDQIDGYLDRVEAIVQEQGEQLGQRLTFDALVMPRARLMAQMRCARGEVAAARGELAALLAETHLSPQTYLDVQMMHTQFALARGDAAAVARWQAEYRAASQQLYPRVRERGDQLLARILIAQAQCPDPHHNGNGADKIAQNGIDDGKLDRDQLDYNKPDCDKLDEALALLDPWLAHAQAHGRTRSEIQTSILMAVAHQLKGEADAACYTLVQALLRACAAGYRRVILDEVHHFRAALPMLLRGAYGELRVRGHDSASPAESSPARFVRDLLLLAAEEMKVVAGEAGFTATDRAGTAALVDEPPTDVIEPLSPQEERVLRLLAAGLSNSEIAQELVVSINTVKTQVQSVYRKLDIHSRVEARKIARHLLGPAGVVAH